MNHGTHAYLLRNEFHAVDQNGASTHRRVICLECLNAISCQFKFMKFTKLNKFQQSQRNEYIARCQCVVMGSELLFPDIV